MIVRYDRIHHLCHPHIKCLKYMPYSEYQFHQNNARQLYIVYDLGVIRDELEFRRDIENAGDAIKVVIVKH